MIAISPEKPEVIQKIYEKKSYTFKFVSDPLNTFSKSLGLAFELEEPLSDLYVSFGIDLKGTQGNEKSELPIPATMIVDESGQVKMLHWDVDYTSRFEPDEVFKHI